VSTNNFVKLKATIFISCFLTRKKEKIAAHKSEINCRNVPVRFVLSRNTRYLNMFFGHLILHALHKESQSTRYVFLAEDSYLSWLGILIAKLNIQYNRKKIGLNFSYRAFVDTVTSWCGLSRELLTVIFFSGRLLNIEKKKTFHCRRRKTWHLFQNYNGIINIGY